MAYIVARLSGEKKRGGFLRIDGGSEIELFDGTILKIKEGTHNIYFSSQSSIAKAGKDILGLVTEGATDNLGESKNYEMTIRFDSNTVMRIDVVTDSLGRVLGTPDCQATNVSNEKMKELDLLYQEYLNDDNEETELEEKRATRAFNRLIWISILTSGSIIGPIICMVVGYVKQVKFERRFGYKPKHSGLLSFICLLCIFATIIGLSRFG